jgi:hypothetical protein
MKQTVTLSEIPEANSTHSKEHFIKVQIMHPM